MSKIYVGNSFSLNMVHRRSCKIHIEEIGINEAKGLLRDKEFTSCVGHESTAELVSSLLGIEVRANRIPITLEVGDTLVVFQITSRLPEGKILSLEELKNLQYRIVKVEVIE
ncbi:MAG: DUF1874 domain-containing protein [candidate division WOR-3 bacterium]